MSIRKEKLEELITIANREIWEWTKFKRQCEKSLKVNKVESRFVDFLKEIYEKA